MKAVVLDADVIALRDVKLHSHFIGIEAQALDSLHFNP